MARHSLAVVAAELRVAQARRELHENLLHLRRSLAQPSSLVAAALFGFSLGRRDAKGAVAGMLARTLLRRPVESPWT
jgi:hypothetical protein